MGVAIAVLAITFITFFSYRSLEERAQSAERVTRSLQVLEQVAGVVSTLKDAETGQRGFVLTGEESYLQPFVAANARLPGQLDELRATVDGVEQKRRLTELATHAADKLTELSRTIAEKRAGRSDEALRLITSGRGQAAMENARMLAEQMSVVERKALDDAQTRWREAVEFSSFVSWGSSALLMFCVAAAALVMSRDFRARERRNWLQLNQVALSGQLQGELRLDLLGQNVIEFIAPRVGALVGSVYVAEGSGFTRYGAHALPESELKRPMSRATGLPGQAAKDNRLLHLRDVPADFAQVESSLGRGKVREIVVVPMAHEGVVQAVVELGFFARVQSIDIELLKSISEPVAVAVRASRDRTRLEELLEETQRQAEELQAQQEELRVSNEELEEQGRVLKEAQSRLENSQAELEQTNSQLEEQAQVLEVQKDDLAAAQQVLQERAAELERANQYKSEFLANMSHELRTPLNSSLILAKLLADNKDGNLTPEQVKFAQTISSAGNDLLALINDILDLAKIEAGKIELHLEDVPLQTALDGLVRSLAPVAKERGLELSCFVDPSVPSRIHTDAQRLSQILKNLLSNALKFTERGSVALRVVPGSAGSLHFQVRDTGIGIPAHQQEAIFEAFRQADGSTHRKYGGTGLGLSISRDLALRLGGEIRVTSTPGAGSTFTLTLPVRFEASMGLKLETPLAAEVPETRTVKSSRSRTPTSNEVLTKPLIEDDREQLREGAPTILVIEDDVAFATVLRDLVRELRFQCVVTHSAGDGLAAAMRFKPNAILLDVNLPDHSGLGVLDQLKRNSETRHIPVHVASVDDFSHEALELGAIGYALKPVKRDALVKAIHALEQKFSQGLRRVLIVEDDERQRDSVRELLSNGEVQIVGVATAAGALKALNETTFDCMVMDLNLPDMTGYDLLERMGSQEDLAFPPVIVYTGRNLTADEEQRLRRFSKSIIIKDARSPERLLDEVTLFLHQMENSLPPERQRMLKEVRKRDTALENRRVLLVEDDVRNVFALTSLLEPKGVQLLVARNGKEALKLLDEKQALPEERVELVLMDLMMPEMDGLTCMREIRKRPEWKKLPIIALTAKAMKDDQEQSVAAGANDYIAKPLDVEKLISLVRVWMPK